MRVANLLVITITSESILKNCFGVMITGHESIRNCVLAGIDMALIPNLKSVLGVLRTELGVVDFPSVPTHLSSMEH